LRVGGNSSVSGTRVPGEKKLAHAQRAPVRKKSLNDDRSSLPRIGKEEEKSHINSRREGRGEGPWFQKGGGSFVGGGGEICERVGGGSGAPFGGCRRGGRGVSGRKATPPFLAEEVFGGEAPRVSQIKNASGGGEEPRRCVIRYDLGKEKRASENELSLL